MSRRFAAFVTSLSPFWIAIAAGCSSSPGAGGGGNGAISPSIVHPVFGPTTRQATPPPPISGGTLIIAKSGQAVAADSDRDAVYVVDLALRAVTTIPMQPGDEPGRLVEDDAGRAHVLLRSGGALATIDLASKTVVARRPICVAPRGVGYDHADATLYVACASGELIQLPAAGGPALRTLQLDRDLRDVIIHDDTILVTRFRSADTLAIGKKDWSLRTRWQPPPGPDGRTAAVAWRTLSSPLSGGGVVMMHQRGAGSADAPVATTPGGYSPPPSAGVTCAKSIVETALTSFGDDTGTEMSSTMPLSGAVVPVDLAISPNLSQLAVAAPGNTFTPGGQSVLVFDLKMMSSPSEETGCIFPSFTPQPPGQPVAVAFTSEGPQSRLVVQTREPAALFLPGSLTSIRLSTISREDTGHDIFHANSGGNIACASCHPEGGDDGRVWSFDTEGPRRTPSLRGTIAGTAPYHWAGEMKDFPVLADQVFRSRMNGPALAEDQTKALADWINRIPAPVAPPALDAASAARGQTLFNGPAGCNACHGGAKLTNNQTVYVGTREAFQVPSLLGVAYRAPFMHDGCAATLEDRFVPSECGGGGMHGNTALLSDADVKDLVTYLGTL